MREMTLIEWREVIIFIISFSIGGIISSIFNNSKISSKKPFSNITIKFNYLVIIISILCLIIMFFKYGKIPLFSSDANIAKEEFRTSSIINTLSYFGFAGVLALFMNNEKIIKNVFYLILTALYCVLLILSAERFFITLMVLSLLFIFSKKKVDFYFLKKIFLVLCSIILIFAFVLQYRGNASQKEQYFIKSGLYNGTAEELTRTEIFRYLGMQERVITNTINNVPPGYTQGTLTISPLLKIIGKSPIILPDVQIYGYTSKSIISKVYADFGHIWFISIIVLSFIVNRLYYNFKRTNNIVSQYYYISFMLLLSFSFYAYIDNLVILFLHFPLYFVIVNILNKIKTKRSN